MRQYELKKAGKKLKRKLWHSCFVILLLSNIAWQLEETGPAACWFVLQSAVIPALELAINKSNSLNIHPIAVYIHQSLFSYAQTQDVLYSCM